MLEIQEIAVFANDVGRLILKEKAGKVVIDPKQLAEYRAEIEARMKEKHGLESQDIHIYFRFKTR